MDTNEDKMKLETVNVELKKTQEQLIHAAKLAGIGQMAAGIAHEINNPLTSILGFVQMALADRELSPDIREDLQTVEKEAKRCVAIIENLLDFAKPKTLEKTLVDLNKITQDAIRLLEYSTLREKITIVKEFTPDLPEIKADAFQLQQVLMNIILNAIHAMRPAGGTLTVGSKKFDGRNTKDEVEIYFKDTGSGMSSAVKDKIFEPFFTTSYQSGWRGVGLGLAISYSIVKEHSGRIEVESAPGQGSVFRVILPVG